MKNFGAFFITIPVVALEMLFTTSLVLFLRFVLGPFRGSKSTKIEFYNRLSRTMERSLTTLSYGAWILAIVAVPLTWLEVAYIIRLRNAMRSISGPSWIENELGFGQILALLLWMPVVVGFTLTFGTLLYLYIWIVVTY
jgi:hypothetical protein